MQRTRIPNINCLAYNFIIVCRTFLVYAMHYNNKRQGINRIDEKKGMVRRCQQQKRER